jgi:hypothetical protein
VCIALARSPQQGRFEDMSRVILRRIDDMGSRIDALEASIGELVTQAGGDAAGLGVAAPAPAPGK